MTLTLILSVGEDSALLESRSSVLRLAGYAVESEVSVRRARERFVEGDFDLVLLCHSISPKDRDRLISSIRASGSRTPIVFIAALESEVPDGLADATVENAPTELLRGIEEVLLTTGRRSVRRDGRFPSLIRNGLPMDAAAIAAEMEAGKHQLPAQADGKELGQNRTAGARRNAVKKQPEKAELDCKGPEAQYGSEQAGEARNASGG